MGKIYSSIFFICLLGVASCATSSDSVVIQGSPLTGNWYSRYNGTPVMYSFMGDRFVYSLFSPGMNEFYPAFEGKFRIQDDQELTLIAQTVYFDFETNQLSGNMKPFTYNGLIQKLEEVHSCDFIYAKAQADPLFEPQRYTVLLEKHELILDKDKETEWIFTDSGDSGK